MLARGIVSSLIVFCLAGSLSAENHTQDSLEKVKQAVKEKKAILIDVREKSEWDRGHLKDAKLIALSALKDDIKPEEVRKLVPKDTIIYCHCASGGRCLEAAPLLRKLGYDVRALQPGYKDLLKAGFEKAPEKSEDKADPKTSAQ